MPDDIERAKEVWEPVNDKMMVGWRHQRNKSGIPVHFMSPSGEEMGAKQYGQHRKAAHERASGIVSGTATVGEVVGQVTGVPDLPTPDLDKPDTAIKKAGLASPAELAEFSYVALMLLFGILAFLAKVPEIAMTQEEAWAFAAPLGNILEPSTINRRYGKYLKEGSDYLYLGYALWAYSSRVQQSIQARRMREGDVRAPTPGTVPSRTPPGASPGATPGGAGPTPLPSAGASPTVASAPPAPVTPLSANGHVPQRAGSDNRSEPARSLPFTPKVG